ncbi:MAG: hypothetical protein HQM03_06945 [Magnetococcales bacterium]|nr:hypothetical protein [Magnetococcales bacterium]
MHAKRFGLVSVLLILLSAIATGTFLGWRFLHPPPELALQEKTDKEKIRVPEIDAAIRQTIKTRLSDLEQLRVPPTSVQGDVNMEMLGYSGQSVASDQAIANRAEEDFSAHVVSMAYVSGGERFAVIDGEMYQEGDELKGEAGTKVRNITTDKVLIAGRSVRQWVKVFNPVKVEKKKKEEEVKAETKVATADAPKAAPTPVIPAVAPSAAGGGLSDALQTLKNYSDVLNSLKGGGQ